MSDAPPPGAMFVASLKVRAQPHKRAEVLSVLDDTVQRMRNTAGCGRGCLMEDIDDPNVFVLFSEWSSADCADSFFSSPAFRGFKGIRILLRDEPVIVLDHVCSRRTRLLRSA